MHMYCVYVCTGAVHELHFLGATSFQVTVLSGLSKRMAPKAKAEYL